MNFKKEETEKMLEKLNVKLVGEDKVTENILIFTFLPPPFLILLYFSFFSLLTVWLVFTTLLSVILYYYNFFAGAPHYLG